MYVLTCLQWIADENGERCPTQLAAVRVDARWQAAETFAALIHPRSGSFQLWTHRAYTGAPAEDFLRAKGAAAVLKRFFAFLRPDDVICWWHQEAAAYFAALARDTLYRGVENRTLVLRKYFRCHVFDGFPVSGSPHSLAAAREIAVPQPEHCAANDAEALRLLLAGVRFAQDALCGDAPGYASVNALLPFQLEKAAHMLHRRGCPSIREGAETQGFAVLADGLRTGADVCPACLKKDMRQLLRQKNRDWLDRCRYNYVYTPGSGIFHLPECHHILRARRIMGFVHYGACIRKGLKPCKACRPAPGRGTAFPPEPEHPAQRRGRQQTGFMEEEQRRAVARQRQARAERGQISRGRMGAQEKRDRTVLSQADLAFFGAKGCSTFHLRGCPKLRGAQGVEGFARWRDAAAAGYRPCRLCRPSPRHDMTLSVPISSREREADSVEAALEQCARAGAQCAYDAPVLAIETQTGRWRLNAEKRPVMLEHINLVKTPRSRSGYHWQPKIFLSLQDAVRYILRHDAEAEHARAEESPRSRRRMKQTTLRRRGGRKRPPL